MLEGGFFMQALEVNGKNVALNSRGMMLHFDEWNEDIAKAIAHEDGLDLQDCHWAAIKFLRDYFMEFEVPPSPRVMIQAVGDKLTTTGKCNGKTLKQLFPKGGCKHACRIAGLPREYCNAC